MAEKPKYINGVNQAGKTQYAEETNVRFQKSSSNPIILLLTRLLNAFGNIVSPINEKKKHR